MRTIQSTLGKKVLAKIREIEADARVKWIAERIDKGLPHSDLYEAIQIADRAARESQLT
jgi:hypothetical protein